MESCMGELSEPSALYSVIFLCSKGQQCAEGEVQAVSRGRTAARNPELMETDRDLVRLFSIPPTPLPSPWTCTVICAGAKMLQDLEGP